MATSSAARPRVRRGAETLLLRRQCDERGVSRTVVVSAPPLVEIALLTIRVSSEVTVVGDGMIDIAGQVRYRMVGLGRPGALLCRRVYCAEDRTELAA